MFVRFIEQLKIRLQQPLPGEDVQFKMSPIGRVKLKDLPLETFKPKKSAVLILLFPQASGIQTVFIVRPVYQGVHSGQVAFPGGQFEEIDVDLKRTALRETYEEVGVLSESIEIIGNLTDVYINPSNFLVTPFVGYVNKKPDFNIDSHEVKKTVTYDIFELNNPIIKSEKQIELNNGFEIRAPYYDIEGQTVWGATAMMISEFNAVVEQAKTIPL